eukprot:CAMPEP_0178656962 /NCGR_PEP_ID=MMETSP0698-20121128/25109_1 /TAXON_ID=265572 /ORGANISM="Extubocellulus spinifer, Strain CCMP396" /LENGTH=371 /DNA_ID=CAMNT_0020299063 /DNA_START=20 /DNA_END=1133 /DNA_ORIENTATION=+
MRISATFRLGALVLVAATGTCQAFVPPSLPTPSSAKAVTQKSSLSSSTTPTAATAVISSPLDNYDVASGERLPWYEQGYSSWKWRDHNINYLELGDPSKPALLLIHGFGASAYHFRHNIPELSKDYHVYAFDLLGFGLSDKPLEDYSAEVWRDQALDFIEQVIQKPTVVAGNSLGGFTSLYAAAHASDREEDLIKGCVLLNAAGRFRDPDAPPDAEEKNELVEKVKEWVQRLVISASFIYTKRPARIEQVLKQVYPVNDANVDDELVESIRFPSLDPNAAEVFYRVITKNGGGAAVFVDDLLARLDNSKPLLLAWGESDPWIRPAAADKIQALYSNSRRVSIDAGHCPHDEAPEAVNRAIREFAKKYMGCK